MYSFCSSQGSFGKGWDTIGSNDNSFFSFHWHFSIFNICLYLCLTENTKLDLLDLHEKHWVTNNQEAL